MIFIATFDEYLKLKEIASNNANDADRRLKNAFGSGYVNDEARSTNLYKELKSEFNTCFKKE